MWQTTKFVRRVNSANSGKGFLRVSSMQKKLALMLITAVTLSLTMFFANWYFANSKLMRIAQKFRNKSALFRLESDPNTDFKMQILQGKALPEELLQHNFVELCHRLANGTASEEQISWAENWNYAYTNDSSTTSSDQRRTRTLCKQLKMRYLFNEYPLSSEEQQFPLAYGLLIYSHADQVYHMLSAFYHPQNLYCIAISHAATADFMNSILMLQQCFPNVIVLIVPDVRWGTFSVLFGVFQCMQELSKSTHPWRYYQYLSGVDLPLRTNREMVRIFKQLNGSANVEVSHFQHERLHDKDKIMGIPYNLMLFKSSLSATFSRETANFLANRPEPKEFLDFLNGTAFPDESFWASMIGIPMPGSFDGNKFLHVRTKYQRRNSENNAKVWRELNYYISRYQDWVFGSRPYTCQGKYVAGSCVFGIRDVYHLLQRPHLVAHKFYSDFQPAGYFCVYQHVRERAFADISKFDDKPYGNLPGPRMMRGESVERWFQQNGD